jgi:phytoene synthase
MMSNTNSPTLDHASDAEATLRQHGKSFAWARRLLGKKTGYQAARLYQFCRQVDDLADDDDQDRSQDLLQLKRCILGEPSDGHRLYTDISDLINELDLPRPVLAALIDGLVSDQSQVCFNHEEELLRYCYHVAGTVGLLMCAVLGCDDRRAYSFAIDLGIAMQLTNIARDVLEDARNGRRYLPAEWLGKISPEQITAAASPTNTASQQHQDKIASAVKKCLDLAEIYYQSGEKGMAFLPLRGHLAIGVAARVYRQIGVQLAACGYRWDKGRQSTNKTTKFLVTIKSLPMLYRRIHGIRRHFGIKRAKPIPHHIQLHDALHGLPLTGQVSS